MRQKNVTLLDYRYFRPLTIASLWLDLQIWGANFTGYHITNLLLHIIMSIAVYLLAIMMVRSRFSDSAPHFFLFASPHSQPRYFLDFRQNRHDLRNFLHQFAVIFYPLF
ncbi:MAG: hypothetical protein R3C26_03740 [Calditrichia bacterium]